MDSKPHILIFGGTGRIGPDVVGHLMQRARVTLLSRQVDVHVPSPHLAVSCDVRDPVSTAGATHFALARGMLSRTEPLGILYMATAGMADDHERRPIDAELNVAVVGLDAVVQAVAKYKPRLQQVAVVFASSLALSTDPQGGLEYELGKAAGEQYCRHMATNPPAHGWRFNILRIGRVSRAPELKPAAAKLAEFLLSDSSLGISGQVFSVCSPGTE